MDIDEVVANIVRGCGQCGLEVPKILAAFVARTIVEGDSTVFTLDQPVTPEKVNEVVLRSIERLLERDSPSLETMKMQIDYDSSFVKEEAEGQKLLKLRHKMVSTHRTAIIEVEMDEGSDFEALTTLYRKIFRFLIDFAPNSKPNDRSVDREVAAALESVFPRIGLKAFVQLNEEEKSAQLMELARIVLGIRLFNRDQNRGGVGIDDLDKEGNELVAQMLEDMDREINFFVDACTKYQKAMIRALLRRRRQEMKAAEEVKRIHRAQQLFKSDNFEGREEEEDEEAKSHRRLAEEEEDSPELMVSAYLIDRWGQELINRRQYLGYLRALNDDVLNLQSKISQLCETIHLEFANLRQLVGNKASVAKEVVYPRFDSLGGTWVQLFEEFTTLQARNKTFQTLCKYRLSFNPTLAERFYADKPESAFSAAEAFTKDKKGSQDAEAQPKLSSTSKDSATSRRVSRDDSSELKMLAEKPSKLDLEEMVDTGATLLTVETTADFMLLPLELQGFCPWTLVHARGLVVPGKPNFGVIRFENLYYVCDHEAAVSAFMRNPRFYIDAIKERAVKNPEYINLLRLHRWFPNASIPRMLNQSEGDGRGFGGRPATKDAATETPTHFIERRIDNNYHWNEWELRKRALRILNLQNCCTTSSQTDGSHFRRDNESQVYEPRTRETQSMRNSGTNPPIITTYMTGLRGRSSESKMAVSKYIKKGEEKSGKEFKAEEKGAARIVKLELDL